MDKKEIIDVKSESDTTLQVNSETEINDPVVTQNYQFVKQLDEHSKETKKELLEGGFNSLYFEVRDKGVRRSQYLKKLQIALNAELKYYAHQMEIISQSSKRVSESLYEELVTNARAFRDNFIQTTHLEVIGKFQEMMDKALEDYEKALERIPLPNHENELINEARRKRVNQATKAYTKGVEAIQKVFDEFHEDWEDNETILKLK